DSLRAAIGLFHGGDRARAEKFLAWMHHPQGRIHGYLALATGDGFFPPGNTPYHDVISTALYAPLADHVGKDDIDAARGFPPPTQPTCGRTDPGDAPEERTRLPRARARSEEAKTRTPEGRPTPGARRFFPERS